MNERTESTPNISLTITPPRAGKRTTDDPSSTGKPASAPGKKTTLEPELLPDYNEVLRKAGQAMSANRQLAKRQENRQIATRSSGSCKKPPMTPMTWDRFGQAMDVLANMKTSVTFSPDLLRAWYASLRDFSSDVFATAVVTVGMSDEKWPDISTIRRECIEVARQKGYDVEKYQGTRGVSREDAERIAQRMGLL